MATQAQTAANRLNAQHSTGPKSEAGIAACRHNATRHGLTGKQIVVKGEDPAAYDAVRLQLIADYQPATEQEAMLIEEIAQNYWRLQRARRAEADMLNQLDLIAAIAEKPFLNLQKYMGRIERCYNRAVKELAQLQSRRTRQPGCKPERQANIERGQLSTPDIGSVLTPSSPQSRPLLSPAATC